MKRRDRHRDSDDDFTNPALRGFVGHPVASILPDVSTATFVVEWRVVRVLPRATDMRNSSLTRSEGNFGDRYVEWIARLE
jgi:hypothetical protein